MMEKVGNVTLDYSRYPGKDFYCDGAVEDDILDIVKNTAPEEYAGVIEERGKWPILYHLSPLRQNIVDWIPIGGDDRVLEVGSGCGAITGALAEKAGSVTCVELSKKRSLINAHRNSRYDNITIRVGNFQEIEPELPGDFDYIFLIGVFEYGQSYIGGDTPYQDFLRILLPHLGPGGRLVIAIENKYGLKYFAGCREDHLGTYFSGVENYVGGGVARTFSRSGLDKIFEECGVSEYHFYYPYPDYKFMTTLYSDERLPGRDELSDNMRNFDGDRLLLFDEKSAFDGISADGLFPLFSNSFLAVIGGDFETKFVKYSNDRAPEYAIRTEIGKKDGGEFYVRKYPLDSRAYAHVAGMAEACGRLEEKYRGGKLAINRCCLAQGENFYAQFEFVRGKPLSELLDECVERNDTEGFFRYYQEYIERIGYNSGYPFADVDLIFPNILVDGDRWTLIDYEWTREEAADARRQANRAVYCYLLERRGDSPLDSKDVFCKIGVTEKEVDCLKAQEAGFQNLVMGGRKPMNQLLGKIGGSRLVLERMVEKYRVQVYEDRGEGYSEESSYCAWEPRFEDGPVELDLFVDGDVRELRIDPASAPCAVRLLEMTFNGRDVLFESNVLRANGSLVRYVGNGPEAGRVGMVFPMNDPNICLAVEALEPGERNRLRVRMEVARLSLKTAGDVAGGLKSCCDPAMRVQIYEDRGEGFREAESYYAWEPSVDGGPAELRLSVDGSVKFLRIDPAAVPCLVRIEEMTFNGRPVPLGKRGVMATNGKRLRSERGKRDRDCPNLVFPTDDPNIGVAVGKLGPGETNTLCLRMEVVRLSMEMARGMAQVK